MLEQLINRLRDRSSNQSKDPSSKAVSIELAATALLLEVAYADSHASAAELERIRSVASAHFKLDPTAITQLLDDAQSLYADSVGAQPFTRALTDSWPEQARYDLVVALWEVALADAQIDAAEEHRIRHLADMLYLDHDDFIRAKLEAKRNQR